MLLGHPRDQAAHPLDLGPARGLPDRRARARPRDRRRDGASTDGKMLGLPGEDHRQPGRVSLHLRARGADLPLRHAPERRLRLRGDPLQGHRRLHEHHAGRRLSGRRPAGGLLPHRADGRRLRGRAQDGPGGDPAEELHPEVRQRLPDQGRAQLRQRRLRRRRSTGARDARLQEVPRRAGGGRAKGKLIGVGFSTYIEACSIAPSKVVGSLGAQAGLWESGKVQVHPTGGVRSSPGSHSHGQGHETTMAQIVADHLGIPMDDLDIVHGDTGRVPFGMGTYGSRSASVGGTAIVMSHQQDQGKGQEDRCPSAGSLAQDMDFADGQVLRQGLAGEERPVRPGRADRLRAAQLSGGPRARARRDELLRPVELLLPLRGARLRGRGRPRHGAREDPALHRGGRRRQRDQSHDRRRHGAWRHRPGRGAGPLGRRGLRRATRASSSRAP